MIFFYFFTVVAEYMHHLAYKNLLVDGSVIFIPFFSYFHVRGIEYTSAFVQVLIFFLFSYACWYHEVDGMH